MDDRRLDASGPVGLFDPSACGVASLSASGYTRQPSAEIVAAPLVQAVKDPRATLLSWGFGPFSALVRGSDQHRAYLTRLCCTLRFSQPLSAFFLTLTVPALFHAGSAHGVWDPAELSPPEDRVASRHPIPS
jgi:hypothetical protein